MEMDKELETELRHFPSNFDLLEEVGQMSKEYVEKIKDRLLDEHKSTGYDTKMETIRAWNLISFLSFVLGDGTGASAYNENVLKLDRNNVVGLCNKAWFFIKKREEYYSVREICKQLKELVSCRVNLLVAKAEIAFCYSRFGFQRYEKSRELFKAVLDQCAEMRNIHELGSGESSETSKLISIPAENICVWTFGYALTFKRLLNINNLHDASSVDLSIQIYSKVCDLYSRIIKMNEQNNCLIRYKARSFVEIGSLVYSVKKNMGKFPNGVKDILPDCPDLWMPIEKYFTTALNISPDDVFVLERSGKHFRYLNKVEESIDLLNKVTKIRDTAFSHHHLALSLKRQLEMKSGNTRQSVPGPEERMNVSRNLFGKFEEAEGTAKPQKPGHEKILTKRCDAEVPKSPAWYEQTNKPHRQDSINIGSNKKYNHAHNFGEFSVQAGQKHQDLRINPDTALPHEAALFDSRVEGISDKLKCTSLDSAYGTMPSVSGLPQNEHFDDILVKSRHLHQPENSNDHNLSYTSYQKDAVFDQRYVRGYYNKRGRWRQNSVTYPRQLHRSFSESAAGYCGRFKTNYQSRGTTERRGNRPSFRKGRSWAGHSAFREKMSIMNMIKSPQKPKYIDPAGNEESIEKIVFHLDKSVEKSNNCGAIYDKGILYRQMKQYEKALSTLKILMRNEDGYCSLVQLSNAYEQAGLCLYDILYESGEENVSLECDMRMYFKKSIEISCLLVSKIPFLKDCWVSAPTLHTFLSGKAKTKEYLKDLSFLYKKFKSYGEAINVLNELEKLTEDETEKAKINLELVENYLYEEKYDDAVLALDMIMCLPDGHSLIDEELYLHVHINGGLDALKKGDSEMARLRLRNALDFSRCNTDVKKSDAFDNDDDFDMEEKGFDVFILCNDDKEEKVITLMMKMSEITLRVTMNFHHLIPGDLKFSGICNIMRRSKHFVLVCDDKPLDKQVLFYFEMMQEIIIERGYGHTVILTCTKDAALPKLRISKFPRILMELNFDIEDTVTTSNRDESFCEKMKELIFKLALGK